MRLKKIDIQGFKSFAKRVEIVLDGNITAIIGPNGSGKSNIADAIRWVLGEQSAKSLRGNKMEDIIFGGSESVKAVGFCEVALTFDNSEKSLSLDFADVTVMRRVYRSGESEYLLNGRHCRLKDIIHLFRDTGIGKEGYSIIGQGRVDKILSGREEERRLVFEEAAGISKYKARKEEAERKLSQTDENLVRIEDVLQEINAQLIPLQEQSIAAKQYLSLYEEIKIFDLNLFLYEYEQASKQLIVCKETEVQIKQEKSIHIDYIDELKNNKEFADRSLKEKQEQLDKKKQENSDEALAVEQLVSQEKLIGQEIEHQTEQNQIYIQEIDDAGERIKALTEEQKKWQVTADDEQEQQQYYQNEIIVREQTVEQINQCIEKQEVQVEKWKQDMIAQMNRASDDKIEEMRLNSLLQTSKERLQQIADEFQEANQERIQVQQEIAEENVSLTETKEAKHLQKRIYDQIKEEEYKVNENILLRQEEYQLVKQKYDQAYLKLNVLSDMKDEHEGYFSSVRKLLNDVKNEPQYQLNVIGIIAEIIHVPDQYETAIEVALGSALQNIVTIDEIEAQKAIQHLRNKQYGRATFLPLTTIRGRKLNEKEVLTLRQNEGCIGIASEQIDFDDRYREVIENLLGRTVVCKDLSTGVVLAKKNHHAFKIVTLEGDIIQAGGSITGGNLKKNNASLLGRERQMLGLKKHIQTYEVDLSNLDVMITEQKQKQVDCQDRLLEIERALQIIEIDYTRQLGKIDMLQKIEQQYSQREAKARDEQEILNENRADIEHQLEQKKQSQQFSENAAVSEEKIAIEQNKLQQSREKQEVLIQQLNECRIRLAEIEQATKSKIQLQERIQSDFNGMQQTIVRLQEKMNLNSQAIEQNIQKKQRFSEDIQKKQRFLGETQKVIQTNQEQISAEQIALENLGDQYQEAQTRLQTFSDREHQIVLKTSQIDVELEKLHNHIWNEYELSYEGATKFKDVSLNLPLIKKQLMDKKQNLRALGNVNMQSIEDYQVVKLRTEELTVQRDDLITAKIDLQNLIGELLQQMSAQFLEQFELINVNFMETFTELFGGGYAELRLSDVNDVLISNIEIIAQPPGKKMQLLSLLSGGERALTAIALLFSMLKLKPTPFCVLDEIEASLDESNVDNFANYLKRYSDKTQFILITHRKGSMAVSDSLYGVAMEGRGVSKIVSVKLEDYLV